MPVITVQNNNGGEKKFSHYIRPMLAKLYDKPFDDSNWVFEIKWDGYRAISEVGGKLVRFYSRNGLSFKDKYPTIYDALKTIKTNAVIDGEVVAFDEHSMPSFQLLQQYEKDNSIPLVYYVFDCLAVNGESIEDRPLTERKEVLKKLLPKSDVIKYCDDISGKGKDFFAAVKKQGLEGMIAKRADSRYYEDSRNNDWLKIKNVMTDEAVIAGYTAPRGGRKYFGALIMGVYENDRFTYIGHTGTGFTEQTLKDLYDKMQPLITDKTPFDTKIKVNMPVTWVKPVLVCNIKYAEITSEGIRRQPVFMGLRIDKAPKEVIPDTDTTKTLHNSAAPKRKTLQRADNKNQEIAFSHLDKVFWPDEGYTKGDVVAYYNKVYPYMGKYLKDRPESLRRTPNGIADQGFFHKDAGLSGPDWVKSIPIWSDSADKEINYIICNDKQTLLYLANLGCIEINPWNSRTGKLDNPDYLVMDLDPSDNNTFDQVVDTALVIKEILDKADAPSFCKTSGATGLHVYVPLGARYDYDQAKEFAHMIARIANERLPDFTSLERSLGKRGKDHIYIDYLQNRRGQTLCAPYSLRPKEGAPVSTPLEWKEVKRGLNPKDYNITNAMQRLEKKGDLFEPVLKKGIDMMKCIKKLER